MDSEKLIQQARERADSFTGPPWVFTMIHGLCDALEEAEAERERLREASRSAALGVTRLIQITTRCLVRLEEYGDDTRQIREQLEEWQKSLKDGVGEE